MKMIFQTLPKCAKMVCVGRVALLLHKFMEFLRLGPCHSVRFCPQNLFTVPSPSPWKTSSSDTPFKMIILENYLLGGGFKHFLFSPLFGEDSHFD